MNKIFGFILRNKTTKQQCYLSLFHIHYENYREVTLHNFPPKDYNYIPLYYKSKK